MGKIPEFECAKFDNRLIGDCRLRSIRSIVAILLECFCSDIVTLPPPSADWSCPLDGPTCPLIGPPPLAGLPSHDVTRSD